MLNTLVLLILAACSSVPPHILAAHKVGRTFIENAKKNEGLEILGTGGSMVRKVEEISVSFIAYGEYDIEKARRHFLSVVNPFVLEIGSSKELKQYLAQPDFPERAANISITYQDCNDNQPLPPNIVHVMMVKGKIRYSVSDGPMTPYRSVYRETYQEALQKVNCEQ